MCRSAFLSLRFLARLCQPFARFPAPSAIPPDAFYITGPQASGSGAATWWPGKSGGWQPRVWSSHPDDATSEMVRARELYVDFGSRFHALEVRVCARGFLSARVEVGCRCVWLNVAKNGRDWARRV